MNHEHGHRSSRQHASAAMSARDHMHGHVASPHSAAAPHDKHAGHSTAAFRDKFWVSLILTVPTLIWGHMLQDAIGYTAPSFAGSHWIPAVFGILVFLYGGWIFVQG